MRVLVVWTGDDGNTCFYPIDMVNNEEFGKLVSFHGHYIGAVEIGNAIGKSKQISDFFFCEDGTAKYKESENIQQGTFDAIILTGIV